MKKPTDSFFHHLHLHFIVVIWGFTGILGKAIDQPALDLILVRVLCAGGLMWLIALAFREHRMPSVKQTGILLFTGAVLACHWYCFYQAIKVSNVSVALASFASTSLFTSLFEPLFFKRRILKVEVILSVVVVMAMSLMVVSAPNMLTGILLGLGAAATISLVTVLNGKMVKGIVPFKLSAWQFTGASLLLLLTYPASSTPFPALFQWSFYDWLWMVILVMVCTVYPFLATLSLMKHINPFTISMAVNMEAVYSILLAYVIFGNSEAMNPLFYLSAAIILSAVFGYTWYKARLNKTTASA